MEEQHHDQPADGKMLAMIQDLQQQVSSLQEQVTVLRAQVQVLNKYGCCCCDLS